MSRSLRILSALSFVGGIAAVLVIAVAVAYLLVIRDDLAKISILLKLSENGIPGEFSFAAETSASNNPVIKKALSSYIDSYAGPQLKEVGMSMLVNGKTASEVARGFTAMEICIIVKNARKDAPFDICNYADIARVKAAIDYLRKLDFIQVSIYSYTGGPPTDFRLNSFGTAAFSALREDAVNSDKEAVMAGKLDVIGRQLDKFVIENRTAIAVD